MEKEIEKENKKIPLLCPKCKKVIAKLSENGYVYKCYLYCKRCKKEYEITYKRANEPKE